MTSQATNPRAALFRRSQFRPPSSLAAFQKKLLPKALSQRVAKLYFWPTLPITFLHRSGALFSKVDDDIIVGVAPVGGPVAPAQLKKMGVKGVINMCDGTVTGEGR